MKWKNKKTVILIIVIAVLGSAVVGGAAGFWMSLATLNQKGFSQWMMRNAGKEELVPPDRSREDVSSTKRAVSTKEGSAVVQTVKEVSPAVVSIVVTKDVPVLKKRPGIFQDPFFRQFFEEEYRQYYQEQPETRKREIGGGTGFIVSSDGYVVTNKHVVSDESADYTVMLNNEEEYKAKVLARDSTTDLAVLKIDGKDLPSVELGDSSSLQVGQKVVAIGNALGEFRNTVSTGVVSGLSRSITAGGVGTAVERLSGLIQTDASINPGNSGGPLLNIRGQVIGINTAMAQGAENIGFAVPINEVKNTINDVKKHGKIVKPWLGVRYVVLDKEIAKANDLPVEKGVLIVRGVRRTDLAIIPGSPADKAGLQAHDIILQVNGKDISEEYPLAEAIHGHKPGDKITLKVWRNGEKKEVEVELEEK